MFKLSLEQLSKFELVSIYSLIFTKLYDLCKYACFLFKITKNRRMKNRLKFTHYKLIKINLASIAKIITFISVGCPLNLIRERVIEYLKKLMYMHNPFDKLYFTLFWLKLVLL